MNIKQFKPVLSFLNLYFVAGGIILNLGIAYSLITKDISLVKNVTPPIKVQPFVTNPQPQSKTTISLAQFEQLQNGMSYEQASQILGIEGVISYSSQTGNDTSIAYDFNTPSASIHLIFRNDQLLSKNQYGLQ